jgi:LemA protein
MALGYFLLIILVLIALWIIVAFNRMVKMKNRALEAWSDIEVQLKRRYNLIPNLVETVKGYAAHEKGVFEKVTEARTRALEAGKSGDLNQMNKAENALSSTLKTLFAVAENYPDLKANANFLELQRELSDTENKIQAARRFYNSVVKDFNTKIESFPSNVMAKMFHFTKQSFFEIEDETEKEVPQVKF